MVLEEENPTRFDFSNRWMLVCVGQPGADALCMSCCLVTGELTFIPGLTGWPRCNPFILRHQKGASFVEKYFGWAMYQLRGLLATCMYLVPARALRKYQCHVWTVNLIRSVNFMTCLLPAHWAMYQLRGLLATCMYLVPARALRKYQCHVWRSKSDKSFDLSVVVGLRQFEPRS